MEHTREAVGDRPDRIVIDGRRLNATRTGVGRYLETLLVEWAKGPRPDAEIVVILSDRSGLDYVPKDVGIRAEVRGEGWPGLIWERFALGHTLRRGDLLFAPANLIPSNWRGPSLLVMHDALLSVRSADFSRMTRWRFERRYRSAVRRATRIIVPSQATAKDLATVFQVRSVVVPLAPDPGFRPRQRDDSDVASISELRTLSDQAFFLFVGKRSSRRNVAAILEAFALHRRRFPGHALVFVGDNRERASGWEPEGVHDFGHVPEHVLHALLATATALLYPSEHEGFGLPIVEAMASGCPVITLRRDPLIEVGGDGPIYLDVADAQSIASAMSLMVDHPEARSERIEAGLKQAARYSTSAFAQTVTRELEHAWKEWRAFSLAGNRR